MKDMGLMHYFPWLEVWQGDGEYLYLKESMPNEILEEVPHGEL
jgi:hypothetical protein